MKTLYISISGTRVEVTEEIYLAYYRSKRRDRYFERDIKTGTLVRDKDGNATGYAPSKEDSLERLIDKGDDFIDEQESVEDAVIRGLMTDKLHEAMEQLNETERTLIAALFFSNNGTGMSEREYAAESGIPRKTIAYRREKVLGKLKILIEN